MVYMMIYIYIYIMPPYKHHRIINIIIYKPSYMINSWIIYIYMYDDIYILVGMIIPIYYGK